MTIRATPGGRPSQAFATTPRERDAAAGVILASIHRSFDLCRAGCGRHAGARALRADRFGLEDGRRVFSFSSSEVLPLDRWGEAWRFDGVRT